MHTGYGNAFRTLKVTFQWGLHLSSISSLKRVTVTLPISVSLLYTAVCSTKSTNDGNVNNSGQADNLSISTFTAVFDQFGGYWICIGK